MPVDLWLSICFCLSIWFLLNDMNFLLHQHVHNSWFTIVSLNRLVGFELSIVTGMSACNWKISHIDRHHKGNDSWGEGFQWELEKDSILGAISYSLRGIPYVVLCPLIYSLKMSFCQTNGNRTFRFYFFEQLSVLTIVFWLIYMNPWFYGIYYTSVLFFSRLTDYENHVGCDEKSKFGFSNNCMNPFYNTVRQNFGMHTAHHYYPDAHWTELPELHRQIQDKIPDSCTHYGLWTGLWTLPGLVFYLCNSIRRTKNN